MNALIPEHLRDIRTFVDVITYLTDELDWPIGVDDLETATFRWDPSELGLPADQVPTLVALKQLRPMTTHQPWGIFFLEFNGPRLPLTALRRLLDKLVQKKRATSGSLRTWRLDDLLFIVTTSTGESVELHFVAMFDQPGHVAEIRSIPWRPSQSPPQHLRRVATELLPHLAWPDNPGAVDDWQREWRSAFKLRHGEAIVSAMRLAERMADTALALRLEIAAAVASETARGPFSELLTEVREQLVSSVTDEGFADMCAQTLVYGTLTARVTDPLSFGASPTLTVVPLANPFLAAFFEQVHDLVLDLNLGDDGLESLVADLRVSNVEAILDRFGDNAKGGDPVVHFYEEFLKRYDRQMRADAGAFYTPQPVVDFMVRAVDELLRTEFGLNEGLADRSSWAHVAGHLGVDVPIGVVGSRPFLSMVDPATGTGTFLVEWMRRAQASYRETNPGGDWSERLHDFVLPSMHAFELMLAPYAIAHLKVALEASVEGRGGDRISINLTDTLEHPAAQASFESMNDPLSLESQRAAEYKLHERFTVVIGNPPYDREQRTDGGPRKGGVVRHGVPGIDPLIEDYLQPLRAAGLAGRHARSLYNDYVYFWRWATWQAVERQPGPGIVAFITARSFLDGVSFGGMRAQMREQFDQLFVIDLGGDGLGSAVGVDENVFDIRVPVAICFGVRTSGKTPQSCSVHYTSLTGTRGEKFSALRALSLSAAPELANQGSVLAPLVPVSNDESGWVPISDAFPWSGRGIQFSRTWPVGPSKSVVERRWRTLLESPKKARGELLNESGDTKTSAGYRSFLTGGDLPPVTSLSKSATPDGYRQVGYRSFDTQWCVADRRVVDRPRPPLWAVAGDQQVFLVTLTGSAFGVGPQAFATPYVPDLNSFRGFGGGLAFPLWRDKAGTRPNITAGLLESLSSALGTTVEAEDLFAYTYGLLGTPAMSSWIASNPLAQVSPPSVPVTRDEELFREVASLGAGLIALHTNGMRFPGAAVDSAAASGPSEAVAVRAYPNDYSYNPDTQVLSVGEGRFGPVSEEVWSFEVSGLKVVQSWLGYRMAERRGRKSSALDDIAPGRWTFTPDLLRLLGVLERTVEMTPRATELLERVVTGGLIEASALPIPIEDERKAPSS